MGGLVRTVLLAMTLLVAASGCGHLFYAPAKGAFINPEDHGFAVDTVKIKAADGVSLSAWYFRAREELPARGTIIQFHGNGQNMTTHFTLLAWVIDHGYNLLTFDYRGYGESEGQPTPEGTVLDGLATIRWAMERPRAGAAGVPDIVLVGQSLGGAVMARAVLELTPAERERVRVVVIDSSFYSYRAIASDILSRSWATTWLRPLTLVLVPNGQSPEDAYAKISPTPLVVLHGDRDGVVPFYFGQEIYDRALPPKEFWRVRGGVHIDAFGKKDGRYRERLIETLDRYAVQK